VKIREFVKDVREEISKSGFNSFGLGDCKAPKVLGDIIESIAGAIFLDSGYNTSAVWKVIVLPIWEIFPYWKTT
jgi:endoribonuclease Dicer